LSDYEKKKKGSFLCNTVYIQATSFNIIRALIDRNMLAVQVYDPTNAVV